MLQNSYHHQRPYSPVAPSRHSQHPVSSAIHPCPPGVDPNQRSRCVSILPLDPQRSPEKDIWKISRRDLSPMDSNKTFMATAEKEQQTQEELHHPAFDRPAEATIGRRTSYSKADLIGHETRSSSRNAGPISIKQRQQQQQQQPCPLSKVAQPKLAVKAAKHITVKSINKGHRVWIKITPNETGASLADKIHTIATFRTQRIVSIKTASGRPVALDKSPIFTTWADLHNFQDGEAWYVEWDRVEHGSTMAAMSRFLFLSRNKNS